MAAVNHAPQGAFDIPDVPGFVPRRLKPWLFIIFVLVVQFSGGIYPAAASSMAGDDALMREDILMAGYASLVGMSINFAVMFRIKFRYSTRVQLLVSCMALIVANVVCALTDSVPVLVATCLVAGWFRMQATFACNSTIQLWLTPVRDMAVFFCYVYIVVDSVIQLSGIATVYTVFFMQWEYMHWIMTGLLALMAVAVLVLVRPVHCPMHIPLLGIDWIGAVLWTGFMLCFTFVCVYGDYFDWWDASEIRSAALLGAACLALNLWRATFLHHPYISLRAMCNRNVVRATAVYLVFFTLLATEHVAEHGYAADILGFDDTNLIDLNLYVLAGIVTGCCFTWLTFARRRWRYRTMTLTGFMLAAGYLAWFYFSIGFGVEKTALAVPLFLRGAASVIISIVFLTSIVQSGLPFREFQQALTVNGFTGAVMGAAFGPAVVGEMLSRATARNMSLLTAGQFGGPVEAGAVIAAMKEVYGWLLMASLAALIIVAVCGRGIRPKAIFPKWRTVRRVLRRSYSRTFGRLHHRAAAATAATPCPPQ